MYKELLELIQFVKDMAPEVFEVYVRQQVIIGWIGVTIVVVFVSVPLILLLIRHRCDVPLTQPTKYGGTDLTWMSVALIVCSIFGGFAFLLVMLESVPRLFNAEYYAIQALLGR